MVKTDLLKCKGGKNIFLSFLMTLGLLISFTTNNTVYGQLACNDNVQVSLDADCEAIITPGMILEGEDNLDPNDYTVAIDGGTPAPTVLINETGYFTVVVSEISTGNSCWGHITVEDKLPPVLDCPCPVGGTAVTEFVSIFDGTNAEVTTCGDLATFIAGPTAEYQVYYFNVDGFQSAFSLNFNTHTIDCSMAAFVYDGFNPADPCANVLAFGDTGAPIAVDALTAGFYQIVVYSDAAVAGCEYSLVSTDELNQYDEACVFKCTDQERILSGALAVPVPTVVNAECFGLVSEYTDVVEPADCAASLILRTYVYTDASGNSASCTMELYLENIGIPDVLEPEYEVVLPCNNDYAPEDIFNYFRFTLGNNVTNANHYAWPTIDGVPLKITACGLGITYEDQIIPICEGEKKVLRTWTLVDWCTGEIVTYIQVIKLVGPELIVNCNEDGQIGYTNHYGCVGDIVLDPPNTNAPFLCSSLKYTVSYLLADENGEAPVNGAYISAGGYEPITDQYMVTGLGIGKNWIRFTVTDDCGRIEYCFMEVVIHDNVPPNPVCDEFTVVSLTSLGWAKIFSDSFDDGSFDNCGEVTYYVRRMDDNDNCDDDPNVHLPPVAYTLYGHDYHEYVPFCCADLGAPVLVEMLVIDNASTKNLVFIQDPQNPDETICVPGGPDNYNFCMVEVEVQDKSTPVVVCPPDVTIHCTVDVDDLSQTGAGTLIGICDNGTPLYSDFDDRDDCGYGDIIRTWFAPGHQQYGCQQRITILDPVGALVYFPADAEVDCTTIPGPEEPWWTGEACSLFGWTVDSDTFFVEDGACAKILNHYTVIDWCTYNPAFPIDPFYDGVWTGTQVIKIYDDVAPTVDCEDDMYGIIEDDCQTQILISAVGTDMGSCPSNWLKWKIKIDLEDDGIVDYTYSSFVHPNSSNPKYIAPTTSGQAVSILIPELITSSMLNHSVEWTVTDGCGNNGSCTSNYMVVDKKPPTPYCINLSTALMDSTANNEAQVDLWACDFDLGSFDNCSDLLKFTFRGDIGTPEDDPNYDDVLRCSSRTFTCADLPAIPGEPIPVEVWVWDEKNNKDFCIVYLTLIDNNNACGAIGGGGSVEGRISGQITTEEGLEVNDVEVINQSLLTQVEEMDMTNVLGYYAFDNNPLFVNYSVKASKDDDYLNGVSTLDLVLVQKHILGLDMLGSGYKVVAADVNNDEKVTAIDLIELRKMILGVYPELPNNDSWRFVAADQILNQISPWPLLESNAIQALPEDMMDEDFIAIKIGDVNGNALANATQIDTENRSSEQLELIVEQTANGISVVAGHNFNDISGYQFTMSVNGEIKGFSFGALEMTEDNFGISADGTITTSFVDANLVSLSKGEVLFTIEGATELSMIDGFTKAEAYQDTDIMGLVLRNGNDELTYSLGQNNPNPFSDKTSIAFTIAKAGQVNLNIYDVKGQVIKSYTDSYEAGSHSILITKEELQSNGVLYYTIESGNFTDTKKMILLK